MAKRNGLKDYKGKTLEEWQAEVNEFCKDSERRICVQLTEQTASLHQVNIGNLYKNYRCYEARHATLQFYDRTPDQTGRDQAYDNHVAEIDKVWVSIEKCLRVIEQEWRRRDNAAKKAANRAKRKAEEENAAAKKRQKIKLAEPGSITALHMELDVEDIPAALKKFPKLHIEVEN